MLLRHYVYPSIVDVETAAIPLQVLLFSCHVLRQAVDRDFGQSRGHWPEAPKFNLNFFEFQTAESAASIGEVGLRPECLSILLA